MTSRSWIIDGRGLSRKVKNVSAQASSQIKDSGAKLECPYCHQIIANSDVSEDWPGLPVGVKFDPSDFDLLEHLAAKCGVANSNPHLFIDEFIPTLECDEGICGTHPENLPGAKKDGSCIHFFYRTFNAYATGRRKRRKIQDDNGPIKESVCWHKTGKTKTLSVNGVQKGYKKIMVLYSSSKNGRKADKCSWVMHQYHLGASEDEKEGEFVVCKLFYQQPKQNDNNEASVIAEESDMGPTRSPKTPKTTKPHPFRQDNTPCDDIEVGHVLGTPKEEMDLFQWHGQEEHTLLAGESQAIEENGSISYLFYDIAQDDTFLDAQINDEQGYTTLAGESQCTEGKVISDFLLCNEMINPLAASSPGLNFELPTDAVHNTNHMQHGTYNAPCSIADLENLEFDTPPDPADLAITFSQDSILDWWDKL
ncbi:hypothetical protein Leryth_013311 [Lithospermum erythrorhizon]|nr:hypothetical protein Leryth_013311 [Lithospermum erythrorhizon]